MPAAIENVPEVMTTTPSAGARQFMIYRAWGVKVESLDPSFPQSFGRSACVH
jgi:hypothetical protein